MSDALPNAGDSLPNLDADLSPGSWTDRTHTSEQNGLAMISPAQHAVLDYAVAGTFLAAGRWFSIP